RHIFCGRLPAPRRGASRPVGEQEKRIGRRPEMRLKLESLALAVAFASFGSEGGSARAAHCGACGYPQSCFSQEQCCLPKIRYRVGYQTLVEEQTKVCYRPVYQTTMKECRYTVCKPVYERHVRECRYTVARPVWEEYNVVRKYTVCKPVYE